MQKANFSILFWVGLISAVLIKIVATQECPEIKKLSEQRKMDGLAICMKTNNFKSEHAACVMKCLLTNAGVLNAEGLLDKEQVEKKMEERAPPPLRPKAKELVDICIKNHAAKLNPADETCKTYEPLAICLMEISSQVCP